MYGWVLAVAVAQLAFRWLVPETSSVTFRRGDSAAHLDLGGDRGSAIVTAMRDQLGLVVTEIEPFGLEGSAGRPLRDLEDGSRTFGKIYSTSHVGRTASTGSAARSSTAARGRDADRLGAPPW